MLLLLRCQLQLYSQSQNKKKNEEEEVNLKWRKDIDESYERQINPYKRLERDSKGKLAPSLLLKTKR